MVPWRACRWFRRNLGSVPFREGYLEVLGFLILSDSEQGWKSVLRGRLLTRCGAPWPTGYAARSFLTLSLAGQHEASVE